MDPIQIAALDHVNMYVSDIKASIDFYGANFGFTIKENGLKDKEPWAIIGLKDVVYLALYEADELAVQDSISHWGFALGENESMRRVAQISRPCEEAILR